MRLKSIELSGFKSFAKKTHLEFASAITSVVGPNGSGKSNIAESFRFVLGEQSMKSMRGRRGEDMIWNGSPAVPRAGRASVKLVFDNSDRALNLDFDEVTIERVVHRDGANDYLLNGSHVRLRDVSELLAQANIGASGHHIISQGEADRVLSASSRERREMLEDALGLTAYLYKREEAEKKLEKTGENMREVEALRKELAPHVRFLQSQVRKIEESQKLRDDLLHKYLEYLARESVYVRVTKAMLQEERAHPQEEHNALDATVAHLRAELGKKRNDAGASELMRLEEEGRTATKKRDSLVRELGRIEGEVLAFQRISHVVEGSIPATRARALADGIEQDLADESALTEGELRARVRGVLARVKEFVSSLVVEKSTPGHSLEELEERKAQLEQELHTLESEEKRVAAAVADLRARIENEKDASREAERELFAAMSRRSELEVELSGLHSRQEFLEHDEAALKREVGEAAALFGRDVAEYANTPVYDASGAVLGDVDMADEPRSAQEERRRKLERMKIRLEEVGTGNAAEVLKEHQETTERDAFLARELEDLALSAASLRDLIEELTKTLRTRFDDGVDNINTEFDAFFKLMFGGGNASLSLVKEKKVRRGVSEADTDVDEEDVEVQEGVEISISLPHKRIKGLHMLSGGERALTSIALIFAMSQVNPPPFLILDETDAALDEANSRRYGDLVETLARNSQLIVITHNRETMSRAGVLYGVTMGQDGVSKLLSVKFEDALTVAK